MNTLSSIKQVFARQTLSLPGKTTIAALLGSAVLWGSLSLLVGNFIILIMASIAFLVALLIVAGIRWASLLGGILGGFFLYLLLIQEPFPVYHLLHPKDAVSSPALSFVMFLIIVLMLWCALVMLIAGITAVIQNYRLYKPRDARWFTQALTGLVGLLLGVMLLGAIAQPGATATAATTNGVPTVHLGISSFSTSTITVTKGASLLLVDDGAFHHNFSNGSWSNGQPQSESVTGAPVVNNLDIAVAGKSVQIGPFNTSGTYHIYCSLHPGMMLTITVQS